MSGHQNNFSYNEFNGLVYQRNWNIMLKSNIPIPPKAEVTGSNPVGCAIFSHVLNDLARAPLRPRPRFLRTEAPRKQLEGNSGALGRMFDGGFAARFHAPWMLMADAGLAFISLSRCLGAAVREQALTRVTEFFLLRQSRSRSSSGREE